jgi:surface protein
MSDLYIKVKSVTAGDTTEWERPADWSAMPSVTATDDTFVGLHLVSPSGSNFVAFTFTTDTGDYQVDWGDGNTDTVLSNTQAQHQYDFTNVALDGTLTSYGYKQTIITVTPVSGELRTANFQKRYSTSPTIGYFYSTGFLDCILSMPNANTGQSIIFGGTTVNHRACERFDIKTIGNATSMLNMFNLCASLQSVPLFDTSNVTTMQSMFQGCVLLQTIPLFNTSNVETMLSMFTSCYLLQTTPLFDTSNVTNMQGMFQSCRSLKTIPLFDTSNVITMYNMFFGCSSLQSVPLFDIPNLTSMRGMFDNCTSLQSVPLFDTSNVTNMLSMFDSCASLQSVPLFDTSNVTNMQSMFQTCTSLQTIPLFDTSNVENMSNMLNSCILLQTIPLFDTSNVTNMQAMFQSCTSLQEVPALDTTSVTNQTSQFYFCYSLYKTDIICRKSVRFDRSLLSQSELVNIFNNLIDLTSLTSQNINITQCWGASALTAGEKQIATDKNWTITG